jgi:mannose-1-phosphate guanylyltransferase
MGEAMKQTRRTAPAAPQARGSELWAIVLAAGEGTRLAQVTKRLYGWDIPKQFAALNGDETLLQQTMNRLAPLVPPHRTVVVVAANRRELADMQLARYEGVQIVSQPANLGTGPGILLPMSLIKAQAPDATVVITPSDHHLPGTQAFVDALERAQAVARRAPAGLVLLGADADSPAADLGWIVPHDNGPSANAPVDLVQHFVEKPPEIVAQQLLLRGALWNTLVVLGSVSSFWGQARRRMPRQTSRFDTYVTVLERMGGRPDATADALLDRLYRSMAPADFSRCVLQNAEGLAVVRLKNSGWCDCGTPDRLATCLEGTASRRPVILEAIRRAMDSGSSSDRSLRPVALRTMAPVGQHG